MLKKIKKVSALALAGILMLATGAGCGSNNDKATASPTATATASATEKASETEAADSSSEDTTSSDATEEPAVQAGEPTVIRWGHNWIREMDTTFVDPITGERSMGLDEYNARVYAEQQVLEKYNAKIEFVQYSDVTENVLQTVLANDPLADIVRVTDGTQGTLLAQNVLQPLDEYESLFADDDVSWMYWGKVYGHNYFLNNILRFSNKAPLCYNITMLEKVDALKENGTTVLPVDLWKAGNWTWSVFEDYLQKVYDFYYPQWDGYRPYQIDYNTTVLQAVHANGASIYGTNGVEINSAKTKEAVSYIDRLITKGLMYSELEGSDSGNAISSNQRGLMDVWRFQWGHSAFCNVQDWLSGDIVRGLSERGEAFGVVPFPRPDGVAADDPSYQQLADATDCYAVPKGVSKEKTELAIKVFIEYTASYYKKLSNSDKAMDYVNLDSSARSAAVGFGYDITNEVYGEDILDAYKYLAEKANDVNEYVKNAGLWDIWSSSILGDSFYGFNAAPKYDVQVEAKMGQVNDIMNNYMSVLSGTDIIDTVKPKFTSVDGQSLIFTAGTDPAGIDWKAYMTAEDNIDGVLDMNTANVDYSEIYFDEVGSYSDKLVYTINDKTGNEGKGTRSVIIYDGTNTTSPTLTIKEEFRTVKVDENSSDINWKDDFVESASDKDGLDIKGSVTADLSELDTTTAGEYEVVITVTDYAGNSASEPITISVVRE